MGFPRSTQASDSQAAASGGNQQPLKYTGPPLPKSALQNILNKVKNGADPPSLPSSLQGIPESDDPTLHLGDSTIASLEDLVADSNPATTTISPIQPSTTDSPLDSTPHPDLTTGATGSDNPTDILARLNTLAPSLRDSKNQLAHLQRSLSTPTLITTTTNGAGTAKQNTECNEAGPLHDFLLPSCPTCSPTSVHLTLPIPHVWRYRRDGGFEITTLGLILFFIFMLIAGEIWAQVKFTQPLSASGMVGFGVDVGAPRRPFVLAKVVWRQTRLAALGGVGWRVVKAVGRLVGAGGDGHMQEIKKMGKMGGVGKGVYGGAWDGLVRGVGEDEVM